MIIEKQKVFDLFKRINVAVLLNRSRYFETGAGRGSSVTFREIRASGEAYPTEPTVWVHIVADGVKLEAMD